jgi:hypothetical protein
VAAPLSAEAGEVRGPSAGRDALPSGYACYTSTAMPGGEHAYRYRRVPLRFPASTLHAQNATHRYRYSRAGSAGKVLRMANCVIPRSDRAVAMMNRRFGVPEHESQMQIEGCVSGGICILPPISGGGDKCDPYMEADWDCNDGGGECLESAFDPDGEWSTIQGCEGGGGSGDGNGGDDGGGSGGGSDGGDDPDPGEPDTWDDGTGRPECERDAAKRCIPRVMTAEEWARLADAIEALPDAPIECKGAKNVLTSYYAQGRTAMRIRVWDGYDKPTPTTQRFGQNLSDTQGRYIEYDSYHIWVYPTLLVHEGLHAWLAENPDNSGLVSGPNGLSNEEWVEQLAQGCTGPASNWQ